MSPGVDMAPGVDMGVDMGLLVGVGMGFAYGCDYVPWGRTGCSWIMEAGDFGVGSHMLQACSLAVG